MIRKKRWAVTAGIRGAALGALLILPMLWGQEEEDLRTRPALPPSRLDPALEVQKLDLEDCLNQALLGNVDLQKSRQEIRRVEGIFVETRAALLPTVTASGSGTIVQDELINRGYTLPQNNVQWTSNILLKQKLYAGGALIKGVEAAALARHGALLEYEARANRVVLEVKRAFYAAILAKSLVQVRQESVFALEAELESQQKHLDAGKINKFNVLRAEVELANAKPQLIRAKNEYRTSMLKLAQLMARAPMGPSSREDFQIVGNLGVTSVRVSLERTLRVARENRPEIKQTGVKMEEAHKRVGMALAGYHPELSAYGGYQFQSDQFSNSLEDYFQGWTVGVQGTWNLFDGLATKGRVDQARAQVDAAATDGEQAFRDVDMDVRQAYYRWEEAAELISSQGKNVEQAEESLKQANSRFQARLGTQLDILNAQVALTQARTNELQARHDHEVARALLEWASAAPFFTLVGSEADAGINGFQNFPPKPNP